MNFVAVLRKNKQKKLGEKTVRKDEKDKKEFLRIFCEFRKILRNN